MTFIETVCAIIREAGCALTPQEIRDRMKVSYPQFYNTESHRAHVAKGNYKHLDHALMAQVYGLAKNARFVCDRTVKPMKLSLEEDAPIENDEVISTDDIETDVGVVYILKTGTYTKDGREIVKIGITSGALDKRITQLYTTSVPYRFDAHKIYRVTGFIELEKALHALLVKFRLNSSREFFTQDAIPFVERIVSMHNEINGTALDI